MFTATNGLFVVSHIIDGYNKQMAGEFKCVILFINFFLSVWYERIRMNEDKKIALGNYLI